MRSSCDLKVSGISSNLLGSFWKRVSFVELLHVHDVVRI